MSRRDLSGAVDFAVLDAVTGGDDGVAEEVLGLFVQQAEMWSQMLAAARLDHVRDALDQALADVAAWRHELMLRSLKG